MSIAAVQPRQAVTTTPANHSADEMYRIRREAAEWVVSLAEHQPAPEELAHLHAAWCAQDARHRQVFDEIDRLWQAAVPDALQAVVSLGTATRGTRHTRRQSSGWRKPVLGLAITAGAALLALHTPAVSDFVAYRLADQRTAVGEVRQFQLEDGSTVTLNTQSAVDIDYTATSRTLRLRAGEVLVDVARETGGVNRPFEVVGRDGAVRALGTRYLVRQDNADSRVAVTESVVEIAPISPTAPSQGTGTATRLHAGQQARFDRHQVFAVQPQDSPLAASWASGTLIFNDAPLPQVLAELARYRAGVLRADNAELQHLRFTGVLPTDNPKEALSLLVDALPVKVTFYTDFVALVSLE